jgi:hypothetical protein
MRARQDGLLYNAAKPVEHQTFLFAGTQLRPAELQLPQVLAIINISHDLSPAVVQFFQSHFFDPVTMKYWAAALLAGALPISTPTATRK